MRIVIDLQGAQTESRFRGIGRYSIAIARGIIRNNSLHEIFIALSAMLDESIADIKAQFADLPLYRKYSRMACRRPCSCDGPR